jgi:environmental stress-induced protein Ves
MPTLIPFASLPAKPWKNGGGSTTEIMVWPQDAGLNDFDWRISMATIAVDGPFSVFPGIDRTLSLVCGQGVDLHITPADAPVRTVALRAAAPTLAFAGELPVHATLPAGTTQDFNVMTRRTRCHHRFVRMAGEGVWQRTGGLTLLFLAAGAQARLHIGDDPANLVLRQCDSLLLNSDDAPFFRLSAADQAQIEWFVVEIEQIS